MFKKTTILITIEEISFNYKIKILYFDNYLQYYLKIF